MVGRITSLSCRRLFGEKSTPRIGPAECGLTFRRRRRRRGERAARGPDAAAFLDEVLGQDHLLGPGRRCAGWSRAARPRRSCCTGPPGTGKTTLAYPGVAATRRRFVALSALSAG